MGLVGLRHPMFLLVSALPTYIGFRVGGTTSVPYDPTETFSPRIRLSPKAYDTWARNLLGQRSTTRLLSSSNVTPDRKLSLLFSIGGALLHVHAAAVILMTIVPVDYMLGLYVGWPKFAEVTAATPGAGLQFGLAAGIVVGYLGGFATGLLWRRLCAI
jgi:hypothetical protein